MAEQGKTPHPTWAASLLWQASATQSLREAATLGRAQADPHLNGQVSQLWQVTWAGSQPCQVSATQSDLQGGVTQTPPAQLGCGSGCGSGSFRGCGVGCERGTCRAEASVPWCVDSSAACERNDWNAGLPLLGLHSCLEGSRSTACYV